MDTRFVILKEKIEWLKNFINTQYKGIEQTCNLYLEMTQQPRKAHWQDPCIFTLLEITDQKRIAYEEMKELLFITVVEDIQNLYENIKLELERVNNQKMLLEKMLLQKQIDLNNSKNKYKEALQDKTKDIWLCSFELKACLKSYLSEKDKISVDCNLKTYEQTKTLKDYEEQYKKIIKNYVKIHNSSMVKLSETINYNSIQDTKGSILDEIDYDFGDEKVDYTNETKNYDKIYDELIAELQSEININEKAVYDNQIVKFGLYKIKKSQRGSYKPFLVIYTDSNHLHAFDLDLILQENINIKIKYQDIITKIKIINNTKFSFFFDTRKKSLNFKEESELFNMIDEILKDTDFVAFKDPIASFSLASKNINIDKEKYEIVVTDKNAGTLKIFFAQNQIKIKSYILKDLFELFFKMTTYLKIQQTTNKPIQKDKDELLNNEEAKIEVIDNDKKDVMWDTIKDENPWYNTN
ncbi:hypothetical protein BDAP_001178 [Binucleata daphniae]